MKIKKLKLNNFAKFTDFECEFDGKITRLVGVNGSGKTTVGLTALWAGLKGIAEKNSSGQLMGERFRFIGSGKASADVEITLVDEEKGAQILVKNHITKASNKITFEAPKGYPIDEAWLNNLLSVAFLSAKNFTQLDGKEQALLLGIDVAEFDSEIARLKMEFTVKNRRLSDLGNPEPVEKVDPVSIKDLIAEKDKVSVFNREQEILSTNQRVLEDQIKSVSDEIKELKERLKQKKAILEEKMKQKEALPTPQPKQDVSVIDAQLGSAEELNRKAENYRHYVEKMEAIQQAKKETVKVKEEYQKVKEARLAYIQKHNFGFKGLSISEEGSLLMDGRPIKEPYFSKGELELIVATLYSSLNPDLKVRFIDDFELLDEENQKKLLERLLDKGFQVITAEVGEKSEKENVLVLRDCSLKDTEEGKKELL